MSTKSSKSSYLAQKRKQAYLEKANKQRIKKLIIKTGITSACVVAAALAVVLCVQLVLSSGLLLNRSVIKSDNFTVNAGMVSYYLYQRLEAIVDYYGDSLSSIGLNVEKPLKNQQYSATQSYFEYLAEDAYSTAASLVYTCEAAKREGFDISDDIKQALLKRVDEMNAGDYGRGLKSEDIYSALYMTVLAAEYNRKIFNDSAPSLKDIEAYAEKNGTECQRIDYLKYTIDYAKDDEKDMAEAKKIAESLAACTDDTEFSLEALKHYSDGKLTTLDSSSATVNKLLELITYDNQKYSGNTNDSWLFGQAEQYETKVIHDSTGNSYDVVMLVTKPYLDTQKTVDVRHILVSFDDFETEAEAKAEAERIYKHYKENGKSEELFASLAVRYSADSGSYTLGGLYERIEKNSMTAEFDEWCFDIARQAGDTDIVKTSFGYHIMYFCGDSLLNWQLDYYEETANQNKSEKFSDITDRIEIKEYKDRIYSIPER